MREMRAGQWVAFDASTQTPHKCGKKTKADPNIKKLAKEKIKEQDSEGIDLGYSDIEINNPSEEQVDEVNEKISEATLENEVETILKKEKVPEEMIDRDRMKDNYEKIGQSSKNVEEKIQQPEDKPIFGSPGTLQYYFWRGLVVFWVLMLLNGLLFGPFD